MTPAIYFLVVYLPAIACLLCVAVAAEYRSNGRNHHDPSH